MIFFWLLLVVEMSLLILNFFRPVVFEVDGNNNYHRGDYYLLFVIFGFVLILYGYAYYIINKLRNSSLRYFPVIEFLSPIFLGNIIQTRVYDILVKVIGPEGIVIRFAGDEFIVLMPKKKEVDLNEYKDRIQAEVTKYNASSGKPYKLSTAIGGRIFDPHTEDMSGLVNKIDTLMYEDKGEYYKQHDRRGRRKTDKA